MISFTTFYLSKIIGNKVLNPAGRTLGIAKDLLVDADYANHSSGRPVVRGIQIKSKRQIRFYSFQYFEVEKINGKIKIICNQLSELSEELINKSLTSTGGNLSGLMMSAWFQH